MTTYARAQFLVLPFLVLLAIGSSGCASYWTRKSCEKTNWFQHGQSIAMRGERVSADSFVMECTRVEAQIDHANLSQGFKHGRDQYCDPATVFQTGKSGQFFSTDLCDGPGLERLKAKHLDGVREYCQKSNGYSAGTKGAAYNKICPKDLEEAFLPEFNRGRRAYLASQIAKKEAEISDLERDNQRLESQRVRLLGQLHSIGSVDEVVTEKVLNHTTYQYESRQVIKPNQERVRKRDNLTHEIESVGREIDGNHDQIRNLRQQIRTLTADALLQ